MKKIRDAELFCKQAESFTNSFLSHFTDTVKLIELVNDEEDDSKFDNLIFSAKYIRGLIRVLKSAPSNPEVKNINQIKADLSREIQKIQVSLESLLSNAGKDLQSYFREKYLRLEPSAFSNFNLLLEDLEKIKLYKNSLKRENSE